MIGTGKVDSILKYNSIGFDMDHTFIRYKMRNFVKLVNQSASIFLVSKKDYPQEIFPEDEKDQKNKHKMWFRAVFDHKTGYLLKIGSNNLIMRGFNGFTPLTKEQIHHTYGKNPFIPNYQILSSYDPDFTNLHEFFAASLVPLYAVIVELKNSGKYDVLNKIDYYQVAKDMRDACDFNYNIKDTQAFRNHDYTGFFYPKLLTGLRHYVHKTSSELIDKLQKLKAKGIKIFFSSNNHYEVADMLMTESVGKDWMDLFDFVIFSAKKPSFFHSSPESLPFVDLKGQKVEDLEAFIQKGVGRKEEKVLKNGNASLIDNYFRECVRKDFKILFFGDTIVSDCVYTFDKKHQNFWDVVFIMEEMQEIENGYMEGEYSGYWQYWGSALLDKHIFSGIDKTIVFDFADNVAHRTFSKLDSPDCLEFLTI